MTQNDEEILLNLSKQHKDEKENARTKRKMQRRHKAIPWIASSKSSDQKFVFWCPNNSRTFLTTINTTSNLHDPKKIKLSKLYLMQ